MTEEFNLSKTIQDFEGADGEVHAIGEWVFAEDVKHFIKQLKKHLCYCGFTKPDKCDRCKTVNELAGDKLI